MVVGFHADNIKYGKLCVDNVTRIVIEKFCDIRQQENDDDLHDDRRMGNEFSEGYKQAIEDIRSESGLERLEIDWINNKVLKKSAKNHVFFIDGVFTVE